MARGPSLIPQRVKNTGIDLLTAGLFIGGSLVALSYINKRFGIINRFVGGAGSLGFGIGEAVGSGLKSIPQGLIKGTLGISEEQTNANLKSNLTLTPLPNDPLFGENGFFTNLGKSIGIGDGIGSGPIPNAYGEQSGNNQEQGGFAQLITAIEKNPQTASTRDLVSGNAFKTFTDIFKDIQPSTNISSTPKQPLNVAEIIKQTGQRLSAQSTLAQNQKLVKQSGTFTAKQAFGGFASANQQETTLQALIAANAKKYPQWFKVA